MRFSQLIAGTTAGICVAMLALTPAQAASKAKKAAPPAQAVAQTAAPAQNDLSPEQLAVADRVTLGNIPCEFSVSVHVKPDPTGPGHFILETGKQKFYMTPVVTQTGAVRLEDPRANAVWLQLGSKSMLMDHKVGRRLADACVSEQQAIASREQARNPPATLFDVPKGGQAGTTGNAAQATESAAK